MSASWHPVFDPAVLEWIVESTPEWLATVLVPATYLGSVYVVLPVVILAYLYSPLRFGAWLGAFFSYYGLMAGIKSLNSADRPPIQADLLDVYPAAYSPWVEHGAGIETTSFPSGNAMVAALIVSLMVVDLRISTFRRRAAVGAFVIALVGYTRLGLAVHYPIDAMGGIALGLSLAGVVLVVRRLVADDVGAMFGVAIALMGFSLWVRGGLTTLPSFGPVQDNLRLVAFGCAIGGLLAWRLGHATDWTFWTGQSRSAGLVAIPFVAVVLTYVFHMSVSHPFVTILWSVVAFGTVIVTPYVIPRRKTDSVDTEPAPT